MELSLADITNRLTLATITKIYKKFEKKHIFVKFYADVVAGKGYIYIYNTIGVQTDVFNNLYLKVSRLFFFNFRVKKLHIVFY